MNVIEFAQQATRGDWLTVVVVLAVGVAWFAYMRRMR